MSLHSGYIIYKNLALRPQARFYISDIALCHDITYINICIYIYIYIYIYLFIYLYVYNSGNLPC